METCGGLAHLVKAGKELCGIDSPYKDNAELLSA